MNAAEQVAEIDGIGMTLIRAERQRQIDTEGYTPEHDAEHGTHVLATAASVYEQARFGWRWPGDFWPWSPKDFKPRDRISNLIRAGALYVAALDAVDPARKPLWANEYPDQLRRSIERIAAELDATLATAAQLTAPDFEAGARQAIEWLRADYPYGDGPAWREEGCEWIADRLAEWTVGARAWPEGCACTALCSMGPTCPGGVLAGLPGSGCGESNA